MVCLPSGDFRSVRYDFKVIDRSHIVIHSADRLIVVVENRRLPRLSLFLQRRSHPRPASNIRLRYLVHEWRISIFHEIETLRRLIVPPACGSTPYAFVVFTHDVVHNALFRCFIALFRERKIQIEILPRAAMVEFIRGFGERIVRRQVLR